MDQKRLFLAIAISVAILVGSQVLLPHHPVVPPPTTPTQTTEATTPAPAAVPAPAAGPGVTVPAAPAATAGAGAPTVVAAEVPRLAISAPRLSGSISLAGGRLDDIVLRDYHETIDHTSPLVRVLEPRADAQPYYVQFGWTAPAGVDVKLPDTDTLWSGAGTLGVGQPVTLSWDNGAGLTFEIVLNVDDNYMFTVEQRVRNATGAPVALYPWSRIRRDYTPKVLGYYLLHEGMIGIAGGTLKEAKYADAKKEGDKTGGVAFHDTTTGGWAGFTDKYWLVALVPDQAVSENVAFRHLVEGGTDRYQVDYVAADAVTAPPGGSAQTREQLFAGAKEVHLLGRYEEQDHIPLFSYAVDWGWFWFFTKPIFFCLDWLNALMGNFGLAILVFTVFVKALFFPLANKSYRSMSKMKLLGPKMQALREQYKDDQPKLQQAMMAMYKAEKVNPASGCLPMVIQIPVFFSLYKVIFINIEMRQAPFFGWIHDLSVVDPTNVFNLFGLLPFDPSTLSPFLHLGAWPLIMGVTMFLQQKMNPPPPDPVQAKLFQWMPLIFIFMLANFPAGLVIYWSWNNLLTVGQQWLILRQTRLQRAASARA